MYLGTGLFFAQLKCPVENLHTYSVIVGFFSCDIVYNMHIYKYYSRVFSNAIIVFIYAHIKKNACAYACMCVRTRTHANKTPHTSGVSVACIIKLFATRLYLQSLAIIVNRLSRRYWQDYWQKACYVNNSRNL